jgi:hypothetical protein
MSTIVRVETPEVKPARGGEPPPALSLEPLMTDGMSIRRIIHDQHESNVKARLK